VTGPPRPELTSRAPGDDDSDEMSDLARSLDNQVDRLQQIAESVDRLTARIEC
jgi:methyl-accepting chemotaxis protein